VTRVTNKILRNEELARHKSPPLDSEMSDFYAVIVPKAISMGFILITSHHQRLISVPIFCMQSFFPYPNHEVAHRSCLAQSRAALRRLWTAAAND
jgi:hypothetical protein